MSIYDLTGTCYLTLKKNKQLNGSWKLNDVDYILTNENGDVVFDDNIRLINEIQQRLTDNFSIDTLNEYIDQLNNNEFVSNYLNINLSKKTFNTRKITTTFKDYQNIEIVHEPIDCIPAGVEIVCVDFKKLNMYETLKVIEMIGVHSNLKWILLHVPTYTNDMFKFFRIQRTIEIKNHVMYLMD